MGLQEKYFYVFGFKDGLMLAEISVDDHDFESIGQK
jgi:hypothetical protein